MTPSSRSHSADSASEMPSTRQRASSRSDENHAPMTSGAGCGTNATTRLFHHLLDPPEKLRAHQRIGGVQHLLDRLEHVGAAAPVLAEDRHVGVLHDSVQHVDAEDEVVEVTDRSQKRLGHDVEGEDVVRDRADEQHLVLSLHAGVPGEPPQEDEDVGHEEEEFRGLAERAAALALDVFVNRSAHAVVEALRATLVDGDALGDVGYAPGELVVRHIIDSGCFVHGLPPEGGRSAPPAPSVTATPPSTIRISRMSASTKVGKKRSNETTSVAGGSRRTRSAGSRPLTRPKRNCGIGIPPNADAEESGTRTTLPSATISRISTAKGTRMNFRSDPSTRSRPSEKWRSIRSMGGTSARSRTSAASFAPSTRTSSWSHAMKRGINCYYPRRFMPKRTDIRSILIIGSGPIVIGQACEFDYSGTQACKALRDEGYRIILVNSNPATIMTDPEFADRTYIEPLTVETLERIIAREKPDALLPTVGGQTGINLASALWEAGVLRAHGVEMIGARADVIDKAEDRQRFKEAMIKIGIAVPKSGVARTREDALRAMDVIGFPAIIRPSFTLGGTGGNIAYNCEEYEAFTEWGLSASPVGEILIKHSIIK